MGIILSDVPPWSDLVVSNAVSVSYGTSSDRRNPHILKS